MKVAVYLRKSREEENESREETLARHERILDDYCVANKLEVIKKYKEVVSGESIENRPKMQQLMEDVKNNKYDGVVVIELERLSRGNQIDQAEILEIFKKSETKIFTLNKIYDLSSDNEIDEEFFEFGLFMSRREYKIIKRRLMRGRKQALNEGYFIASVTPFGFTKEKGDKGFVLIPDPIESKIVSSIFYQFVNEDKTLSEIRDYLNINGIKPKKAKSWNSRQVRLILRNKTYTGLLGCEYKNGTPQKYIKGKHKPIIDDNTFNIAQDKLNSKMTKLVADRTLQNPFASILKCSCCGYTMKSTFDKSKNRYILKCTNGCVVRSYTDDVEKKVIQELENELKDFNYFLDNFNDEIEKKKEFINNEIIILNKEIDKKETMIDKCCEMLEEGIYSKEKYLSRVSILEKDLNALKVNLEALRTTNFDESDRIKSAVPILYKVLEEYWRLDTTQKNMLLKSIIEKIEYNKTTHNGRKKANLDLIDLKIFLKI